MKFEWDSRGIEFSIYDHPLEENFLHNYNLEEINIKHEERKIIISFNEKFIIPAIGIFINKLNCIISKEKMKLWFISDTNKIQIKDINELEDLFNTYKLNKKFKLVIESSNYDLLKQQNIICYYNTNDTDEDELLENLFKNSRINNK